MFGGYLFLRLTAPQHRGLGVTVIPVQLSDLVWSSRPPVLSSHCVVDVCCTSHDACYVLLPCIFLYFLLHNITSLSFCWFWRFNASNEWDDNWCGWICFVPDLQSCAFFPSSFPTLHILREYTFLLKTEAKAVYSCLSFSLGRATGSGPVEDMDAFLFLQLTYKGHVVRIFFPSTSSLCMLECSALVQCSVTLIERLCH